MQCLKLYPTRLIKKINYLLSILLEHIISQLGTLVQMQLDPCPFVSHSSRRHR